MTDTLKNDFQSFIGKLENISTDTLKSQLITLQQAINTSYHLKFDLVLIDLIKHELKKRANNE